MSSENEIIRSKYPIYDYSYGNFVVNKDKKYTVYNDSGKIVIVDLDYVKLESDLLIGVKNNKLNLYSYVQDATGILKTAVDLSSIKYTDINVDTTSGYEIIIKTTDNKEITYKYSRQGIKISQNTSDNTTEDKPANGEVEGDNTSEEE